MYIYELSLKMPAQCLIMCTIYNLFKYPLLVDILIFFPVFGFLKQCSSKHPFIHFYSLLQVYVQERSLDGFGQISVHTQF